jgi:hypothetical protein
MPTQARHSRAGGNPAVWTEHHLDFFCIAVDSRPRGNDDSEFNLVNLV